MQHPEKRTLAAMSHNYNSWCSLVREMCGSHELVKIEY
jgi:hypothetical protein